MDRSLNVTKKERIENPYQHKIVCLNICWRKAIIIQRQPHLNKIKAIQASYEYIEAERAKQSVNLLWKSGLWLPLIKDYWKLIETKTLAEVNETMSFNDVKSFSFVNSLITASMSEGLQTITTLAKSVVPQRKR